MSATKWEIVTMLITVRSLTLYALLDIVLRTLCEPTIKLVYYMTSH